MQQANFTSEDLFANKDKNDKQMARFLMADYSIDCNSQRYTNNAIFAWFMIAIYPLGSKLWLYTVHVIPPPNTARFSRASIVPLLYGVAVYTKRDYLSTQAAQDAEKANGYLNTKHLQFLVIMYKPEFFYFEIIECARRLLLASIIGVVAPTSAAQPALALLISMAFTHLYT